ncbi:precorrin-2 dehydrogenase/sirohydrochlorin ferrochelatase family protein [Dongia sedimenti]|uniref:precorrin-2 dehydrogenase n=1 Tax=Dongia sedimenti TaxID=3064282 RepID=A0ABU0YJD8_9PROT|nr:NAD(P)-dependent oxidoreductase [Rhodospirillaceae bacterium R-7]
MRLSGRRVLVVGSGQAAAAKQRLLEAAGARVDLVAQVGPLHGYALVFGTSGDDACDRTVSEAARAAGIPVNVVDRPELSDFIMPAVVDRGEVVIGISTGGGSPILAQRIRALIEDALPNGIDRLAAFARRFRSAVQTRVADNATRRRFWERFFDGEGADLVMAGEDYRAARKIIRDLNAADATRSGEGSLTVIELVSNNSDDLTLGALRALRKADVIAHDADVAAEILDYARRDARRVDLDAMLPQGARVVVLRSMFTAKRAGAAQ